MDLCALHIKPNIPIFNHPNSSPKFAPFDLPKVFQITVPKSMLYSNRSIIVRANGNKNSHNDPDSSSSAGNGDHSVPEGEGNNHAESHKPSDTGTPKFHHKVDWREFRAILVDNKQLLLNKQDEGAVQEPKRLGSKWAHPLTSPETGCVLVATEKLDGVQTFERSVVFLLGSGTRHPQEGPFGVIINRPLNKKIKNMKPTNLHLATTFSDCQLHFGGPLEASIYLLKTKGKESFLDFEEVVPGLCFGSRNSLDQASALVKSGVLKPQDFRFFVGYAGWQLDQLREEIEAGFWHVAACSSNLIFGRIQSSSSEGLWEEILQLMGGSYAELSRKPKRDI
ncbi:hypothetical protein HanXRQr2_Chr04g0149951 [Helianthus annuus]|uniref:Electron transporter n=1 Tax=Helianthus annuus TaxID=4232 RepID=A0A251UY63_HELAN|nr:UPF0301 protein Cpar_0662 [Helianthus annuus]KAF5808822.1 hypothetical protein HanXRQr2_Chr04g0149951 [Helianthus annuus]